CCCSSRSPARCWTRPAPENAARAMARRGFRYPREPFSTCLSMHRHLIELVLFSTYAELRAEAARSYLGLIWWVLEPAMMMGAFWLVFDVILKTGGPDYLP